jgi:hypothetical protein
MFGFSPEAEPRLSRHRMDYTDNCEHRMDDHRWLGVGFHHRDRGPYCFPRRSGFQDC